jgi:monothiol glutaredoxin
MALRNALKIWTGWLTLPMVFVRGTLVAGRGRVRHLLIEAREAD